MTEEHQPYSAIIEECGISPEEWWAIAARASARAEKYRRAEKSWSKLIEACKKALEVLDSATELLNAKSIDDGDGPWEPFDVEIAQLKAAIKEAEPPDSDPK